MSSEPFFSIILPTLDRAYIIERAIDSVLNQTFNDWELIIIDDGSTDRTAEVIKKYTQSDKRINYNHQENKGLPVARNVGIDLAKGSYICLLDSDDEYLNNHLNILYRKICEERKPVAFLYTYFIRVSRNSQTKIIPNYHSDYNLDKIVVDYNPPPSSVCIHRDIFCEKVFDPSYRVQEDMLLWVYIAQNHKIIEVSEYTVLYYDSEDGITGYNLNYYEGSRKTWEYIFRKSEYGKLFNNKFRQQKMLKIYSGLVDLYLSDNNRDKGFQFYKKCISEKKIFLFSRFTLSFIKRILSIGLREILIR